MTTEIFQIEALAELVKSPSLEADAALIAVGELLAYVRSSRPQGDLPILRHGSRFVTAASDQVDLGSAAEAARVINDSMNKDPTITELQRIRGVLASRWQKVAPTIPHQMEDCATGSAVTIIGWEQRQDALHRVADLATASADRCRDEASEAQNEFDRAINIALPRLSGIRSGSSQPSAHLRIPTLATIAGALAAALLGYLNGVTATAIGVLGVVGGLIGLLVVYSVRNRAINPTPASNRSHQVARQLLKPASEALTRYFEATSREAVLRSEATTATEQLCPSEGHLELALQTLKQTEELANEKIRELAPGPFVAFDESSVAIGGLALAKKVLQRYNASASGGGHLRLLRAYESRTRQTLALAAECGDAGKLLAGLLDTAIAEIGTVTLFETLTFVRENPVEAEHLFAMLEALVTSVRLAVQLKPGLENELDYRSSPANISIGVPGVTGPLASLVQQWFPGASLFESSSAGAIEVFFDHRNLAREHLLLDDLSNEPYNSAPDFLRQTLWHFPRRMPALVDREGDDDTGVVSLAG